jgi:hypothetical protein
MLYGAEVAVCSEINTEHINTVLAECTNLLVRHVTSRLFKFIVSFIKITDNTFYLLLKYSFWVSSKVTPKITWNLFSEYYWTVFSRRCVNVILLTLILLMWRIGWANCILIYIQQDATLHSLFISGNCSTCFGWYFHPSSRAHTTVSTASVICHTVTAICRYRGRVGTGLSVLWVAYATHNVASCWIYIGIYLRCTDP